MNLSNQESKTEVSKTIVVQSHYRTSIRSRVRASARELLAGVALMLLASVANANFFIKVDNQTLNQLNNENVEVVLLSPDNEFVYTLAGSGNVLGIWAFDSVNGIATFQNTITAQEIWPDIPGVTWTTRDMAISSGGEHLYVLGASGSPQSQSLPFRQSLVKLDRDTATGALSYNARVEFPGPASTSYQQLALTPDARFAFAVSPNVLHSVNTTAMTIDDEYTGSSAAGDEPPSNAMTISEDGRLLAVGGIPKAGGDNPSLILFDVDTGTGALSPRVYIRPQALADGTDPLVHPVDDTISALAISSDGFLYAAGRRVVGTTSFNGLSQWAIEANSLAFVSTINKQVLLTAGAPPNSATFFTDIDDLQLSNRDQRFLYVEEGPGGGNGQIVALLRDPSSGQLSWVGSAQDEFPAFTKSLDTTSSGRYVIGAHRGSGNAGGFVIFDTAANLQTLVTSEPGSEGNTQITVTISNNGPTTAVGSTMIVQADIALETLSTDCTGSSTNTVTCTLSDLAPGDSTNREFLIATPAAEESQTVSVTGSSYKFDPDVDDNTVEINVTSTGSTDNEPMDGAANDPVADNTGGSSGGGGCTVLSDQSDWGMTIMMLLALFGVLRRQRRIS